MAYAANWGSRKWPILASAAVIVGLSAALFYLMGGCETKRPGPAGPQEEAAARGLRIIEALSDPNTLEASLQVAYFHAKEGRLPRSLEEVREKLAVPGWPPVPMVTTAAAPITYRATGDRTYELALPGADRKMGTADDVVIPQEAPADRPPDLAPEAFRNWWVMRQLARLQDIAPRKP
jgi:hypothetical protein